MKYIKKFESINSEMKIGDYVLIKFRENLKLDFNISQNIFAHPVGEIITNFINNTIGQIEGIQPDWVNPYNFIIKGTIIVKYTNVPKGTEDWFRKSIKVTKNNEKIYFRNFDKRQVVSFGETPEEVEIKMTAQKYNL